MAEHATLLAAVTGYGYDHGDEPLLALDDPASRTALVDALVRDARPVLAALGEAPAGPAADVVGLVALVAG